MVDCIMWRYDEFRQTLSVTAAMNFYRISETLMGISQINTALDYRGAPFET